MLDDAIDLVAEPVRASRPAEVPFTYQHGIDDRERARLSRQFADLSSHYRSLLAAASPLN